MNINKVNLKEGFSSFQDHWNPRIAGELNGQHVKLAKLKGEFVMHHHENEDEMFFVVNGQLKMVLDDKTITLNPGEFLIIPKGVNHKPIAIEEVHIMLFEPASTLNTGNIENTLTKKDLKHLS
ncbi:MAG: cupin domain-containing protein [Bacteroidota bacterium]